MPLEDLLPHEFEAIQDIEDDNLVVHGLACQPFLCKDVEGSMNGEHWVRYLMRRTGCKTDHWEKAVWLAWNAWKDQQCT